jgi:hypothetical protein
MVIKEEDFILEYEENAPGLWNLQLLRTVKPRGGQPRDEFQDEGYGYSMTHALNIVIHYRLAKKKDTYTLKEFLQEYKQQLVKLKQLLQ